MKEEMDINKEWIEVEQPDRLDEDYILRHGDLFAVVATRAEYTGWAIYRGEYTQAGQLARGGYVPNIAESAWKLRRLRVSGGFEVNEDGYSYYTLDDATLHMISEPMMREAEDALETLLQKQQFEMPPRPE